MPARGGLLTTASIWAIVISCCNMFVVSSHAGASESNHIDLSKWELTLPVNSKGQLSGKALVKRPARVSPPWLNRQPHDGLLFWAPAQGATTPHSLHSRTELVSLSHFKAGERGHTLTATVVVKQLPPVSRAVIIGQIHGEGTYSAAPFVFLEIRGDRLVLSVESKPKLKGSIGPSDGEVTAHYSLLKHIRLEEEFTYVIATAQDSVSVTTELGSVGHRMGSAVSVSAPVPSAWRGDAVRFSAGDYEQDDASKSSTGGGRIIFYNLAAS